MSNIIRDERSEDPGGMRDSILPLLSAVGVLAAFASPQSHADVSVERVLTDRLPLTVAYDAYPFDAEVAADTKGGGDVGMSDKPLKIGETVIAECMIGDAVRIQNGEFAGLAVSTNVDVLQPDSATSVKVYVFDKSTDVIALQLKPCQQ